MATTISKLSVSLIAKTGQFDAGMDRSRRTLKRFGASIGRLAKRLAKLGAVMSAAAGVGAAYGIGRMVTQQMKLIDATAKLSDRLGIATEKLAGLQLHAQLSGVKVETLNMALQRMIRRVSEAAVGTGEAKDAIKELGLSALALHQAGPHAALLRIADALHQLEDRGKAVRLAFKMFDSEGVAMLQMMTRGAVAIKRTQELAERLGLAFTRIDAAKIEQANDAILIMRKTFEGLATILTVEIAPFLTLAANAITELSSKGLREGMLKAFEEVTVSVIQVTYHVGALVDKLAETRELLVGIGKFARIAAEPGLGNVGGQLLFGDPAAKGRVTSELDFAIASARAKFNAIRRDATKLAEETVANRAAEAVAEVAEATKDTSKELARYVTAMSALATTWRATIATPFEQWESSLIELNRLVDEGYLSWTKYRVALDWINKRLEDATANTEELAKVTRAMADPSRLRFAPATIAGTAEAVQTRWRATGGMIGAATVAVQQQQLKVQQSMVERLDEIDTKLGRGLRLDDVAVLDVVT